MSKRNPAQQGRTDKPDRALSAIGYFFDSISKEMELMQKRWPVGFGPSSKTWPRWLPQRAHTTSVRVMPWLVSGRSSTASAVAGS